MGDRTPEPIPVPEIPAETLAAIQEHYRQILDGSGDGTIELRIIAGGSSRERHFVSHKMETETYSARTQSRRELP